MREKTTTDKCYSMAMVELSKSRFRLFTDIFSSFVRQSFILSVSFARCLIVVFFAFVHFVEFSLAHAGPRYSFIWFFRLSFEIFESTWKRNFSHKIVSQTYFDCTSNELETIVWQSKCRSFLLLTSSDFEFVTCKKHFHVCLAFGKLIRRNWQSKTKKFFRS